MSDLISTKAVIHDLKDMAVEDDFCLNWLFNEREGHDLRIEVSPRLQEARNLQGLQSVDELAETTSPKMRVSEGSTQEDRLGKDLLQNDNGNPDNDNGTPVLSELKRDVLGNPSLRRVRLNAEELEDNLCDLQLSDESEGNSSESEEAQNEEQSQTIEEDILHQQFWEAMKKEWKKRLEVMKSLRIMRKRIKFNHLQCERLIETYLNVKVLMQHPKDYLVFSMRRPNEIHTLRCVLDTFVELTRVMKHGEILVQDCTGEDWIHAALTRVTIEPKHRQWKAVTPIYLHLQDFQWILHVVGVTIASILSVSEDKTPIVDNKDILRMFTLTGKMPNDAMVQHDRHTFLKGLLEYLNTPSSSEPTTDYQCAQFLVWKLQGRPPANEAQFRSSNNMTFIRTLGKGSYGVVSRRKWLRIEVAMKEWTTEAYRAHLEQESEFADLQHPHIVPVLDYWLDGSHGMLTMELMGAFNGEVTMWANLWDRIQKGPKLSIFQAINVMVQIAEAMKYLKECRVVHRDLKATNILVSCCRCGDHNCLVAKLADFGESKHKPNSSSITTQNRGTRSWMAPEVCKVGGVHKYTMAADVYSFAVTCSEILTGKIPFEDIERAELHDAVVNRQIRPELPDSESCPTFLSAYIYKCWSTDPKSRPIFSDICEFLRYCKERLLRNELAFNVPSFNENEARVLLKHLGLQWCLQKDENGSPRLSDDVYRHVVMLAIQQRKWMELDSVERLQVRLDFANYLGDWTGAEHQYNIAVELLQNVAEDYYEPISHWRLGYCFELGLGVAQDFEQALLQYNYSATVRGDRFGRAYVELGRCYALGRGVPKDVELASHFWLNALECVPVASTILSIKEQIEILVRKDLDGPGRLIAPTECRERAASRLLDLTIAPTGSPGRILLKYAFDEDEVALRKLKDSTSCEEPTSIEDMEGILKGEHLSPEAAREAQHKYNRIVLGRDAERSEKEKDFIVKILQCVEEEVPVAIPKGSNEKPRHTLDVSSKNVPALPQSTFWLFVISFLVWFMLNNLWPKGLSILSSPRQPLSSAW